MKKYGKMNNGMTAKATSGQRDARRLERKIADLQYEVRVYTSMGNTEMQAKAERKLSAVQEEYNELFA